MEFHLLNEPQQEALGQESDELLTSESKKHIMMNVTVMVLCFFSLVGLLQLGAMYDSLEQGSHLRYFLSLAVVVFSFITLAYFLIKEAKLGERLALTVEYQRRVDQLEKRSSYLDDLLELVADQQNSAIMILDRHNRYFFVNEMAARNIGRPAVEIVGQPPIKVLPNDRAQKLETFLAMVRGSGEPLQKMDSIINEKGETRFMQCHYSVVSSVGLLNACVVLREDDVTGLVVEKERREQMLRQVIDTMVAVVDRRDPYATGHSSRVGQLSRAIALELDLDDNLVETTEIAGSLMNFGKVLVSRRILTKTSSLTPEELQRVRDGILTSADILEIISFNGPVVPTLRQVLERYDGSGVPNGLSGEAILITARIVSAANAFVAFVSPRAHRPGLSFKEVLNILGADCGKAFDEKVLVALTHYVESRESELDWLRGGVTGSDARLSKFNQNEIA